MHVPTSSFENMFIDRVSDEGKGYHESLTEDEKTFYKKLSKLKFKNPEVAARNFKEFSGRIVKVAYSSEAGKCCIRGHVTYDSGDFDYPKRLRKGNSQWDSYWHSYSA